MSPFDGTSWPRKITAVGTTIIAVIALLSTIAYVQQTGNNWRMEQSACIEKVEGIAKSNKQRIVTHIEQDNQRHEKLQEEVQNAKQANSEISRQVTRLTAILERVDRRTKALNDQFTQILRELSETRSGGD